MVSLAANAFFARQPALDARLFRTSAAPVVGDEPAYSGFGIAQGVLRAADCVASWRACLAHLGELDAQRQRLARLLGFL